MNQELLFWVFSFLSSSFLSMLLVWSFEHHLFSSPFSFSLSLSLQPCVQHLVLYISKKERFTCSHSSLLPLWFFPKKCKDLQNKLPPNLTCNIVPDAAIWVRGKDVPSQSWHLLSLPFKKKTFVLLYILPQSSPFPSSSLYPDPWSFMLFSFLSPSFSLCSLKSVIRSWDQTIKNVWRRMFAWFFLLKSSLANN